MIPLSSLSSNILSAAGEASKSNAATTLMTTNIGFIRAGMVPLDKKTPKEQKAQVAAWVISATILSLITQLSVYKLLGNLVDNIGIKNLKLTNFGTQYKNLKSLPIDEIEKAFKTIDSGTGATSSKWAVMKQCIKKAFDPTSPKERELAKKLIDNLDDLAKAATKGRAKELSNDAAQSVIKNVKMLKGSGQFFMFLFGAALFTGYIIPALTTKYLPQIMNFFHEKTTRNGKSLIPKPKETKEKKKKHSNFKIFGIPLLASGGILGLLRYHSMDLSKGFGQKLHNGFKAIAQWDYGLSPNSRIVRNITTNAILRPYAALIDGRIFLAVYNFMMEMLSAGSLLTTKKLLGSADKNNGLIGATIKKFNITNAKQMKGVEFMMTHGIQTFLVLGVILGLTTTVLSRHITNFTKKTLKIKEEPEKENEVPVKNVYPAANRLNNAVRQPTEINHNTLSTQFDEYLIKTGNAQLR